MPDSVKKIGEMAFDGCYQLEEVKLPPDLEKLEQCTFGGCKNLKRMILPESIKEISRQVFTGCVSLEMVRIGKNTQVIGNSVFSGCLALATIEIDPDNPVFTVRDNILFRKDQNGNLTEIVFYPICKKERTYSVPEGIKKIGPGTFKNNEFLEEVQIPSSVESIGKSVFSGCTSLKSAVLPPKITDVENYTFAWCYALESVKFPENLKTIGDNAFQSSWLLKEVTIPETVTKIGENAFWVDTALERITFLNRNFFIYGNNAIPPQATIVGYADSDAEKYALTYGRKFEKIEDNSVNDYTATNTSYINLLPVSGMTLSGPADSNIRSGSLENIYKYIAEIAFQKDENNATYREILKKTQELTANCKNDTEKARAIMTWLHDYMIYGYFIGAYSDVNSIYTTWTSRHGNCMGQTELYNYMLYLAGIQSAVITGDDHQWSGVLLDGRWVMVDATNNLFDFNVDEFKSIRRITVADGPFALLIENLRGVTLTDFSKDYIEEKGIEEIEVPAYVKDCYRGAFSNVEKHEKLKVTGKTGTEVSACAKNTFTYYVEENGRFTASNDPSILPKPTATPTPVPTATPTATPTPEPTTTPAHVHKFGSWVTVKEANALQTGLMKRTCKEDGATETKKISKLKATVKLNATGTLKLQVKQNSTVLKVKTMTKGDKVKFWKSSNAKIVKVQKNGSLGCKLTAVKAGTARITVTMASGVKASINVKVTKNKVTTTKITLNNVKNNTLALKKGRKFTLSISRAPMTVQDKVTFTSSNKSIVTVSAKGVVTAKKKGKAVITIKSGSKTVKIKVTVK